MMKLPKTVAAALLALTGAAVFASSTVIARSDREVLSLRQVDSVWVDANVCTDGIRDQLRNRGFLISTSPRTADAVLMVDVFDQESYVRDSARYKAILENPRREVLFTASGKEYARSMGGLCDNIGDSIAESIDEMS